MKYIDTRHKKFYMFCRECCKPDERSQRNRLITTYSNITGRKDAIYCQGNDSNQLAMISTGEIKILTALTVNIFKFKSLWRLSKRIRLPRTVLSSSPSI